MSVTVTIEVNGVSVPITFDDAAMQTLAAAVAPAHTTAPVSPYMSIAEAAEYLRCSRQRIYDLCSARRLSRFRDGSRVLLAQAEVEQYVNSRATRRRT